jgi:hypothetical protein
MAPGRRHKYNAKSNMQNINGKSFITGIAREGLNVYYSVKLPLASSERGIMKANYCNGMNKG